MNVEEELRKRRKSGTATINTSLKRQSKFANLDKEITFHWARHCCCTRISRVITKNV